MAEDLLTTFKRSIGDFSASAVMDDYYRQKLSEARAMLLAEDISEQQAESENGRFCVILLAKELTRDAPDITTNNTLAYLKSLLSAATKGDRHAEN